MNRYAAYPATQLMTIEEAKLLSSLAGCEVRREERQRARVWSWQSVEGALSQTVTDEQLDLISARK